jgi:hypothetical protein
LKTSIILRQENDYLERETERDYQRIVREGKDMLSFRFSEYQSLHPVIQWRIVQKMVGWVNRGAMIFEEGESSEAKQIFLRLEQSTPSFFLELPRGICLEKRYDSVLMKKVMKKIPPLKSNLLLLAGPISKRSRKRCR